MRVRSWMAALALIGASSVLIGRGLSAQGAGRAQDASQSKSAEPRSREKPAAPKSETPSSGSQAEKSKNPASSLLTIQLDLAIAGLGADGCDVEVKPANPSCKFRPSPSQHVDSLGHTKIELHDVELRGRFTRQIAHVEVAFTAHFAPHDQIAVR